MIRIVAGAFAALLLVASPVMAQDIKNAIETDASAKNIDFETASDQQIDEAMTADLQAEIAANSGVAGVTDIAALTDEQLAAAVGAIIANNPTLTDKQVLALVRAASRSRTSVAGAVQIAAAASYHRPSLSASIADAVISVTDGGANEIRAATVQAANDGFAADTNQDGVVNDEDNASES